MASVYEEIERISKAKEDIEDAIESCGVTVPDTELIDKYANYIRSIPNNIFSNLNVDTIGGGDTFIRSIKQINGKINANIGGIVSNTESGIVPKIDNSNNSSITDQAEEWVLTSDKGATPTWKRLPVNAFLNENDDTTYTLSGSLDNNNYNITLTSSNGSTSGAEISCMSAASSNNAGTAGLVPAPTKGKQTSFLRGDGTWAIPTNTTYDAMTLNEAKTGTAIIARTITAKVLHDKISTMIPTSMDWSNITNKPSLYNPSTHTHASLVTEGDNRNVATTPTDYSNNFVFRGLKKNETLGIPTGNEMYSYLVGLKGWSDRSGGGTHELAFNDNGIFRRNSTKDVDTWGSWTTLLDSNNYANSLDGIYRRLDTTEFYASEVASKYWIDRCKTGGGGWAYNPITIKKSDKSTTLLNLGVLGQANDLSYIYLGSNAYDGNNLRIYSNGNIRICGTTTSQTIVPSVTNSYTLGSTSAIWNNIYTSQINIQSANDYKIILNNTDTDNKYQLISFQQNSTQYGRLGTEGNDILKWNGNTMWHAGNDGIGSGLDADLLDGTHKSGLLTDLTSSSATNLSITVGGTTLSVTNLLARHISPIKDLNTNVTTKTVASVKTEIVNAFSNISYGIGSNVTVPAVAIANWDTDTTQLTASSVYSMIKIGGGYSGTQYGQWLLSTYNASRIGIVGRSSNTWSSIKWIAFTDDAPTQIAIGVSSTSSYYPVPFVTSSGAGNKQLYIDSSTGTTSTSNGIRYNPSANTLYCSGGFYESSDERLKNIINPIKIDLDKLSKLRKVNFLWNSDPDKGIQLGVIAQDIQKLFPEIVTNCSEEGYLSIAYDKLSVIALAAIDKLYEENKKLKERLTILENKIK